jgi:AcrR family transcriptional regulator
MPRISASERDQYLADRRNKILDAAIIVFAKKGFSGANVSDITTEAGIAKGTIYLYFKSKEEIFTSIIEERSYLPYLRSLMELDLPMKDKFRQVASGYLEYMEKNVDLVRLLFSEVTRFPDHSEQIYLRIIDQATRLVSEMLEEMASKGEIGPLENPYITARVLMGALVSYILSQFVLNGQKFNPISRDEWIAETMRVFEKSLS